MFLCSLLIGSVHATSDTNDTLSSEATHEPIKHMDIKQIDKIVNPDNDIKSDTILRSNSHDETTEINKNNDEDEKAVPSADDNIMSTDNGTFTTLQNKIDAVDAGSTIKLENDYIYNTGFDKNGITISKSLTIDGNGQTRIFKIVGNNSVINNLKLINGLNEKGGAIYCIGNLTLNNVTFENNNGNNGNTLFVGKTYLEDSDDIECIINNCTFKDFANLESDLTIATNKQTIVKINNTIFKNISSKKSTIFCWDAHLNITNTIFEDLHSTAAGGAIRYERVTNQPKFININNSTFINITSFKNGGAIYNKGSDLIINYTKFINCSSDYGGAILQLSNQLEIMNCNFTNNYAIYSGGAIYTSNIIRLAIADSRFTNNHLNFTEDSTLSYGGAIYADLNNMTLNKITFINNTRNTVYCYDCKSNISDCIFENNSEAIYLAFSQLDEFKGNIYNNDTLILNDNYYNMIITGPGIKLELIDNTIDVTNLPTRFDSRDWGWVSPVKNQGESGACWAFSTCAALESALLKATGVEYDLSINNMHKTMLKFSKYGHDHAFEGGNETLGPQYVLSWFGVFSQEYDPFRDTYGGITTPLIAPEVIHIQDVIMLPPLKGEEGRNNLKELIMKCGGVSTLMLEEEHPLMPYFNNVTNAYYYFEDEGLVSHAITVVGWDDNYPASNFKVTPPGNGAWIIKNSYGTEEYDNGYIYISYYDTVFSKGYQIGYLIENTENYTKNYQTDIGGEIMFKTGSNYAYKNNYQSIGNDLISAVGTYFNEKNQEYILEIYVNNVLKLTQSGSSPFMGFHTIKLTDEILINPGDNFTAVMKTKSVPLLKYSRTNHEPKTSFINVGDGWKDLSKENFTASLKVYTKNLPSSNDTKDLPFPDDTKDLPSQKATKLTTSSVTTVYNTNNYLIVNLKDENNNPIEGVKIGISINGIKYLITNAKGQVKFSTKSLVPKTYTAKITFSGNNLYMGSTTTVKVVVKKAKPKIVAKKKTYKSKKKVKKFTITLKDNKGKPIKKAKVRLTVKKITKKTKKTKTKSKK